MHCPVRGRHPLPAGKGLYLREEELLEVLPGLPDPKYPPVKAIAFHTRITSKYYGEGYATGD